MQVALVLCPALAAISLLLPYDPSYDPWGWLVWGRELGRLQLHTDVALSWKPLPALLTAPLAPLGAVDVQVWLLLVRAAGLLALVFAFRLGNRLGGPLAGGLAAVSVLLLPGWIRYLAQANIEPVLVLLMLAAADSHFAGRRRPAFVLLTLLA